MRRIIAHGSLVVISISIGVLFYQQEVKYWLPTEIPTDYVDVPLGTKVELSLVNVSGDRKKFFHFYNPNCPCSKFNFKSYKELLKNYSKDFDCYAVVQNSLGGVSEDTKQYLKSLGVKLIRDDKSIANLLGVYATPQIVLLDQDDKIYYRGNYNQARYCTNKATNYAQIAIDSMLIKSQYHFPKNAFTAYGCTLERHTD